MPVLQTKWTSTPRTLSSVRPHLRATALHRCTLTSPRGNAGATGQRQCKRTLKYLLGVAQGCWVVTEDWLKECIRAKNRVSEKGFEVAFDGIRHNGPRTMRQARERGARPFYGRAVCFYGPFPHGAKADYQTMLTFAGGAVVQRLPVAKDAPASALRVIECGECGQQIPVDAAAYERRTVQCPEPSCRHRHLAKSAVLQDVVVVVPDDYEAVMKLCSRSGRAVVGVSWLLTSLSAGCVLPVKDFAFQYASGS